MRSVRRVVGAALLVGFGLATLVPAVQAEEAAPNPGTARLEELAKLVQKQVTDCQKAAADVEVPYFFGHFAIEGAQPGQALPQAPAQAATATAPAPVPTATPVPAEPPPTIKCNGVMALPGGMKVVIGSSAYAVGDSVQGARILSITADRVWFDFRGQRFSVASR